MTTNVGSVDRLLRIVLGLALLAWAIWGTASWHALGWIGVVPLLTALMSSCPLYSLVGVSTCPAKR